MKTIRRIGIAGGSYNPIHIGHLIIMEHFREQMQLDIVKILPAKISPSKINEASEYLADNLRIDLINKAIADNPFFELDAFEINKDGISYTIDTLKYIQSKFPEAELFLLIGEDQAIAFNKWKQWQEIANNCQICIAPRNIYGFDMSAVEMIFQEIENKPIIIKSPLIEISSTEIRQRMKDGRSIRYLVP